MNDRSDRANSNVTALLEVMRQLRNPKGGCPWDIEQDFRTIAPYTIEEAYEVADAIDREDLVALKDELGDLLFQVVFHAQMAAEAGAFDFADVVQGVVEKMELRHPHVFGSATIETAEAQTDAWEQHKAEERKQTADASGQTPSVLDGVARGLPALSRAIKLQRRAARIGFDWPETTQILDKIDEEVVELKAELAARDNSGADGHRQARIASEMGDVLLSWSNFARRLDVDPEESLRRANQRFEQRFRHMENAILTSGRSPESYSLDEMEALWVVAKQQLDHD